MGEEVTMDIDEFKKPMKVAIYTRVSTKEQVEGIALILKSKLVVDIVINKAGRLFASFVKRVNLPRQLIVLS